MQRAGSLLVLGEHGTPVAALAERARVLGFRVVRAKTPQDAVELAADRRERFEAALIESELPVVDLAQALRAIRTAASSRDLVFVATGPRPPRANCERLRKAGVALALWEPMGDHALRFQLNRAMSDRGVRPRGQPRVPAEWSVRLWSAGIEKAAEVYSLSGGGAYLATRRPSPRGAGLAVELRLPSGPVTVTGKVVYTNVPGNLMRKSLPIGMAVAFSSDGPHELGAIDRAVSERVAHFVV